MISLVRHIVLHRHILQSLYFSDIALNLVPVHSPSWTDTPQSGRNIYFHPDFELVEKIGESFASYHIENIHLREEKGLESLWKAVLSNLPLLCLAPSRDLGEDGSCEVLPLQSIVGEGDQKVQGSE